MTQLNNQNLITRDEHDQSLGMKKVALYGWYSAGGSAVMLKVDSQGRLVTSGSSAAWGAITGTLSDQTDLQTALNAKVTANGAITGATKTKVTYDAKGLVTAGADATTADIADSLNKRYVTDANLTTIGNQSGTNTGDQLTFKTIAVSGQSDVVADSATDTLTLVAGTNMTITTNASTDTITFESSGSGGSSSLLRSLLAF